MSSIIRSIGEYWEEYGFTFLVIGSIILLLLFFIYRFFTGKSGSYDLYHIQYVQRKKPIKHFNLAENNCRSIVETIFNKPFPRERPSFLLNPKTGKLLECDMLNHDLKLCIEYNGYQHYHNTPFFHKNKNSFASQVQRDQIKRELLAKNGYDYIEVPYTIKANDVKEYINNQLKLRGDKYKSYLS